MLSMEGGSEETHSEDDADAPLEERKMRRKQRNRLSAAASRQRKKEWVETLQEHLRVLTAENDLLRQRLDLGHSAQAGAAAGLLAFGGGAPAAANAISADRVLGRCLRAHGISEAIHVQVHAEHLGKAAALAATAEGEAADRMPPMSISSSASVIDTPDPTPPQAGAPTPMTMSPALRQLPPKAQSHAAPPTALDSAFCAGGSRAARACKPPPIPLSQHDSTPVGFRAPTEPSPSGDSLCGPDETTSDEATLDDNPSTCAKRARAAAPVPSNRSEGPELHVEADERPAADTSVTGGAAPIQLDLVRALRSLRASASAGVIADLPPDHLVRVARVQ